MRNDSSGRRTQRLAVLLGAEMQPVVDNLTLDEMIAVAAYAGSLDP